MEKFYKAFDIWNENDFKEILSSVYRGTLGMVASRLHLSSRLNPKMKIIVPDPEYDVISQIDLMLLNKDSFFKWVEKLKQYKLSKAQKKFLKIAQEQAGTRQWFEALFHLSVAEALPLGSITFVQIKTHKTKAIMAFKEFQKVFGRKRVVPIREGGSSFAVAISSAERFSKGTEAALFHDHFKIEKRRSSSVYIKDLPSMMKTYRAAFMGLSWNEEDAKRAIRNYLQNGRR